MANIQDIRFRCYKKVYIDKSVIAGQGLFAGEAINKGELVMSFGGVIARVEDRYSGLYMSSTFACITDDVMICERDGAEKDYSDYLNHSCNPNIGMYDCLTLVAIQDISIGEELVYDYSFCEADENWKLKRVCNCGNSNCRKYVTGNDWKKVSSKDELFEYYSPFIQRRIIAYENIDFLG